MNRRWLAGLALALVLAAGGWWLLRQPLVSVPRAHADYSEEAFADWLDGDRGEAARFAGFTRFLEREGVARVVPAWQLTRTDMTYRGTCERPQFLIPPRETWSAIVPVLQLVRDEIEPAVGQVEVVSSYRAPSFNGCVGGAGRSRHLGFAAVDLIVPGQADSRALFGKLCALHRRIGQRRGFGLGAYFDPDNARPNVLGRFHVDVSGYRSWGYSKHSASSGCRLFASG